MERCGLHQDFDHYYINIQGLCVVRINRKSAKQLNVRPWRLRKNTPEYNHKLSKKVMVHCIYSVEIENSILSRIIPFNSNLNEFFFDENEKYIQKDISSVICLKFIKNFVIWNIHIPL